MSCLVGTSQQLTRTTGLPSSTSFTACGWAKWIVDPGSDVNIFYVQDASNFMGMANGTTNRLFGWGATFSQFPRAARLGAWFFWAMQGKGTGGSDHVCWFSYFGSESFESVTGTGLNITLTGIFCGDRCLIFNVKVFDAVLTLGQLRAEKASLVPQYGKLNMWTPLQNSVKDFSGLGRDWGITSGSPAMVADAPPIPWDDRATVLSSLRHVSTLTPGTISPTLLG